MPGCVTPSSAPGHARPRWPWRWPRAELRLHVRLDERGAGFFALGLSMATGRAAVVCTTSGTAAAELHPAVREAHHGGVPLLVCTADRPPELHGVGAPQTMDQTDLYGGAVRWFSSRAWRVRAVATSGARSVPGRWPRRPRVRPARGRCISTWPSSTRWPARRRRCRPGARAERRGTGCSGPGPPARHPQARHPSGTGRRRPQWWRTGRPDGGWWSPARAAGRPVTCWPWPGPSGGRCWPTHARGAVGRSPAWWRPPTPSCATGRGRPHCCPRWCSFSARRGPPGPSTGS